MNKLSGPSAAPLAGGAPRQLVVLLHGVGADGADLITLSQAMGQALPHARVIAPNGPEPCDMAPMGYQWFSLSDRNPETMLAGVQRERVEAVGSGFRQLDSEMPGHRPSRQLRGSSGSTPRPNGRVRSSSVSR